MSDEEMVCSRCGNPFGITRYGSIGQYCSEDCEQKAIILRETKQKNIKDAQQKHEKIEKMAWEFYCNKDCEHLSHDVFTDCWEKAEKFYEFVEQKQFVEQIQEAEE